jgi:hypothetical protein
VIRDGGEPAVGVRRLRAQRHGLAVEMSHVQAR